MDRSRVPRLRAAMLAIAAFLLIAWNAPQLQASQCAVVQDFDGDGKSDFEVVRPSTWNWYIRSNSAGAAVTTTQFGIPGDIPVPADYDGDCRRDIAVWRPSNGIWYILNSNFGSPYLTVVQWGLAGDIPVPEDYDGDGKADLAVFRPSIGSWLIRRSSNGTTLAKQWGLPNDIPVPADYDHDGAADPAVWRAGNGGWYISATSAGTVIQQWGLPTDIPMPAAVDANGADLVVWRPSTGGWYMRQFPPDGGGTAFLQWGLPTDIPLHGDYNGDGYADQVVWRPSLGTWYITSMGGPTQIQQWGLPGDLPGPDTRTTASAVLNFEGLQNLETVGQFYNGGTGGSGSTFGRSYGVAFTSGASASIDADAGGGGQFGGEPSPNTTMFLTAQATMNVPSGFTTGFSCFYTSPISIGQILIYSDVNAAGLLLAVLNLPLTPLNGAPDPTGTYSPLVPIGVTFNGTAKSVVFTGPVNQAGFDNLTLGSATPFE